MTKPSGLATRFTLARDTLRYRTIASIDGEIGCGKTYFTLTASGPVLIQNIDKGTEGVVEQFRRDGKEIYEENYDWRPGDFNKNDEIAQKELRDQAIEIRDKWVADYRYAIHNGIRTISWDTESRIWQVFRYAEFGAPNADSIKDYDHLNQSFEACINDAKEHDINLFVIRSMKDKWGQTGPVNPRTGKKAMGKMGREVWGYEHTPGLMMMELSLYYDEERKEYMIRLGKCRHNVGLQFTDIPRVSFPELGTLLIPGSSEKEWS